MRNKDGSIRHIVLRKMWIGCRHFFKGRMFKFAKKSTKHLDLTVYNQSVGSYKTTIKVRESIGKANENRLHNMKLCCDKLDGLVIKSGQYFSLMQLIKEPKESNGFKSGPMLIRGELKQIAGGGICQVSTTLFNAALTAGLEIVEKHNHTWDIWGEERFIDLGLDATYAYGRKDLIVKNTHECDLVLRIKLNQDDMTMEAEFLSAKVIDMKTTVTTKVIKELTHSNKKAKVKGWIVETQRHSFLNGIEAISYHGISVYKPIYEEGEV